MCSLLSEYNPPASLSVSHIHKQDPNKLLCSQFGTDYDSDSDSDSNDMSKIVEWKSLKRQELLSYRKKEAWKYGAGLDHHA